MLAAFGIFVFRVPFTGDFPTFALAALLYVTVATGIGLLISAFMRSQVAAIFATTVVTMIPAVHYSGLIDPVASITGGGRLIGEVFPTSFFITIARGTFSKALGFVDLQSDLIPLAITVPVLLASVRPAVEEAGQLKMRIANVVQLGIKELRGLGRDHIMVFLILYVFTFAVYTQATVSPELLNRASIAIVDEDQSQLSARIAGAFYPPRFLPPELITAGEMDRRMDQGTDTFALDIPPHFERDVLNGRGRANEIQLNVDATRVGQAFAGGGYVQAIVSGEVTDFLRRYRSAAPLPVDLALRAVFNPNLERVWFGAITSLMAQITMLSVVLAGAALIREREHGTVEHLLVMPVTPTEIMVSKIWSMGLVVWIVAFLSLMVVVQGVLAGADPRLHPAVHVRRRAAALRHDCDGDRLGDLGRIHAAVRAASRSHAAPHAVAVRRGDAAGEHAADRSEHHAGRAGHLLRHAGAGDRLPRRRHRHRLAPVPRPLRPRYGAVRLRIMAFPQGSQLTIRRTQGDAKTVQRRLATGCHVCRIDGAGQVQARQQRMRSKGHERKCYRGGSPNLEGPPQYGNPAPSTHISHCRMMRTRLETCWAVTYCTWSTCAALWRLSDTRVGQL